MKLDELGVVGRGKSKHRPRNDPSLYGGPYPFVQTGDVKEADLWLTQYTQTYNEKGLAQSKLWPIGTLCITIAANIAETAILKLPACFPDSIVGFRPHPGKADARFMKYYIDTLKVRMQNASKGTTQDNLSVDKLTTFDFAVPGISVQQRIADILSAYDDLIENNTRRIKILEDMAQMLYREWFVNFRFPGHEKVGMVESELGPIPEGWCQRTIGEVVQVLGGGTPATSVQEYWQNGEVTWYSPTDLTAAGTMFISASAKRITRLGLEKSSARLFPPKSVMMTSRATIGVVAINRVEACTNQGFITCIPSDTAGTLQLYFWLLENRPTITSLATGATFKEINKATFRQLPIIVAPDRIRSAFELTAMPITELLGNLVQKNTNLRTTRDFLLPKLISGEIPVEAAAELVEQPA